VPLDAWAPRLAKELPGVELLLSESEQEALTLR
jgi:hypothetical protein